MTSYARRLDPSVRAFLTKHGYNAKEHLFHNVDYDAFMKLPDAMFQNLGLTAPSFIADRRTAQTIRRSSSFVADTTTGPTNNSVMLFPRRLDPDDDVTDSGSDDELVEYSENPNKLHRKEDNREDVIAINAPRLGDRCCGGAHTKRGGNVSTQTRAAPRPQSPSAYQTQHPGCYF